jgi:PIN domain nuclease of toxin-antitoxin system
VRALLDTHVWWWWVTVQRRGISPAVAAEVANLPHDFPRDPADRIIVATARIHDATLITGDKRIIAAKLVPTVR